MYSIFKCPTRKSKWFISPDKQLIKNGKKCDNILLGISTIVIKYY